MIVGAGAVITEEWRDEVPAVVFGWYSGSEGGAALAEVLLGATDVTGRLPYSIPTAEAHLPYFDRTASEITYDRWFGQRLLDRDGHDAAFPLGYGLSYTTFSIDDLVIESVEGESVVAAATVTNTGSRRGPSRGAAVCASQRAGLSPAGTAGVHAGMARAGRISSRCSERLASSYATLDGKRIPAAVPGGDV